jgi:hypothetical protein
MPQPTKTYADLGDLPDRERKALQAYLAKDSRSLRWLVLALLSESARRLLAGQEAVLK